MNSLGPTSLRPTIGSKRAESLTRSLPFQMPRNYHTVSIEDREMFAYNKRHDDLIKHFAQHENSIKYCYSFLDFENLFPKAILNAYKYISLTDWEEAHY